MVDELKLHPGRGANHWFDGLVGCAAAASIEGVSLTRRGGGTASAVKQKGYRELGRRLLTAANDDTHGSRIDFEVAA